MILRAIELHSKRLTINGATIITARGRDPPGRSMTQEGLGIHGEVIWHTKMQTVHRATIGISRGLLGGSMTQQELSIH